ncbi:RNI-like protein [Sodiomyces alkalinus F11]|uniref:RNI-like protein n=1 Tax=Sodiomyces alkalinus (strain CBS 110278 / VKM F-3762 / F11) TaxID=1314773 RepID=A0A3N2PM81_SODAK|nr:RNI-like protein [Sodiomyces alkalinus F11]ROT35618.1 RNI-like protein [Sodiomyces alkalinus F11]
MEQVHGVDVSWMTHGSARAFCPADKGSKIATTRKPTPVSPPSQETPRSSSPIPAANGNGAKPQSNGGGSENTNTASRPIPTPRPPLKRSDSGDKSPGANGTSPSRRNSWFSSLSSKFSSSPTQHHINGDQATNQPQSASPKEKEFPPAPPPRYSPPRHAVLQHANKPEGDQPYTPAPPGRGQASFLGVFRRLSSTGGLTPGQKYNHGLVERRVLNVDRNRERCPLPQLRQPNLRRVAFSVDVEIAPQPKYADPDPSSAKPALSDKTQKRKMTEKGEGEALKHPKSLEIQKEHEGVVKATGEPLPKEPEKEGTEIPKEPPGPNESSGSKEIKDDKAAKGGPAKPGSTPTTPPPTTPPTSAGATGMADKEREAKKKEKKKKSEEERKARKEKKRKQAEANGTIPMEIRFDDSDSSAETSQSGTTGNGGRKTTSAPTTNPVRIYRRCCQLRETPILKKIAEQLSDPANSSTRPGVVDKLDLTGYWLQLPDLITLGDYLAVVPVKEVILENCGLSDEGLRVILAGLLAAKLPETRRRRLATHPDGLAQQGGFVERLVLKENKFGVEGWKHICLFIYLCRSLKYLDLSMVPFPRSVALATQNGQGQRSQINTTGTSIGATTTARSSNDNNGSREHITLAGLVSKAFAQRLGGPTLELLNIGGINPSSSDLGTLIDGIIECGIRRLGLPHNNIDNIGLEHVARFISSGHCEGLDLGGNDLRESIEVLAQSISDNSPLWGLSLAECNLRPGSLCKIFPKLLPLKNLRFIDLSHNQELCSSEPSAVGLLRKYLPKLQNLKRIHLADVSMTSEQAIALAEILPEVHGLAHISFLENPKLVKLADATTEESREEACALYASLLAATRVSPSIICVDIDVPSERSGEVVKAMAKQVVAYCLRNMQRIPIAEISSAVQGLADGHAVPEGQEPPYPDVLVHLVGHDVLNQDECPSDHESAPDDDYVIGGTGLVKALTCCLENRGDDSRRQSVEFTKEAEDGGKEEGVETPTMIGPKLPSAKAKDMSKHLLAAARKIRIRLQPAVARAKAHASDEENLRKLLFLDTTLANIIKRFEDEFPDTRVGGGAGLLADATPSLPAEVEPEQVAIPSDAEDDFDLEVRPSLSRTNSAMSLSSRALAEEEGRMLRTGHMFRSGIIKPEYFDLLNGLDETLVEPNHVAAMQEMVEELQDPDLSRKMREKGVVRLFREDREQIREALRVLDPEYWERFVESQEKARGNVQVLSPSVKAAETRPDGGAAPDESAVED